MNRTFEAGSEIIKAAATVLFTATAGHPLDKPDVEDRPGSHIRAMRRPAKQLKYLYIYGSAAVGPSADRFLRAGGTPVPVQQLL